MTRALFIVCIVATLLVACGDDDGGETNNNNNNTSGICGDGILDTGEQCDEGAANSESAPDACRPDCRDAWCGDGVVDTNEVCDDGAANSDTEADACRTTCENATCGDGAVDTGEACDDGNTVDGDGCAADCLSDESCGNAILDTAAQEQCDCGLDSNNLPQGCDTTIDALDSLCTPGCRDQCAWSNYFDSTSDGETFNVAVDSAGNVAITGRFVYPVDLGGGPLPQNNSRDKAFVALFDPDGAHLWSISLPSTGHSAGKGVGFDSQGNVIAMGTFTQTIDLGTGQMACLAGTGTYVVKLDATNGAVTQHVQLGNVVSMGAPVSGDRMGFGMAVDANDNVVVVGEWTGCWGSVLFPCSQSDGVDIFIYKLEPSFAVDWGIRPRDPGDDTAYAVAIDPTGNIFIQGAFVQTLSFSGGWSLDAGNQFQNFSFVTKLAADGTVEWAKMLGIMNEAGVHIGSGITALSTGDVVAVGAYSGSITFSPAEGETSTEFRAYAVAYDTSGTYLWHTSAGTDWAWALAVTHDANDNIAVTGGFENDIDLGGGLHSAQTTRSAFLARYDVQGEYLGSRIYGINNINVGMTVAADPSGRIVMGGVSEGNVNFGCGAHTHLSAFGTPYVTMQNPF